MVECDNQSLVEEITEKIANKMKLQARFKTSGRVLTSFKSGSNKRENKVSSVFSKRRKDTYDGNGN